MALAPLYANVAIRNGVAFTYPGQRVFRRGRYVNERASGEEVGETAKGAAYVESSLRRMRSLRIHGAQCAWDALSSASSPCFVASKTEKASGRALGAPMVDQGEESDSSLPAAEEGAVPTVSAKNTQLRRSKYICLVRFFRENVRRRARAGEQLSPGLTRPGFADKLGRAARNFGRETADQLGTHGARRGVARSISEAGGRSAQLLAAVQRLSSAYRFHLGMG